MDSNRPQNNDRLPVRVTVEAELEPVRDCTGFIVDGDALELTFSLGDGKYKFSEADGRAALVVEGLLSYTIDFTAPTTVAVDSPFGRIELSVKPEYARTERTEDGIAVSLAYTIESEAGAERRAVKLMARKMM